MRGSMTDTNAGEKPPLKEIRDVVHLRPYSLCYAIGPYRGPEVAERSADILRNKKLI